jgi:hypothetical protein
LTERAARWFKKMQTGAKKSSPVDHGHSKAVFFSVTHDDVSRVRLHRQLRARSRVDDVAKAQVWYIWILSSTIRMYLLRTSW